MTENFSSLANNNPATLPSGWKVDSGTATTSYASAGTQTTQVGGTATPGTITSTSNGGTYNFADGKANNGNTERAVGWMSSSSYASNRNLFVRLVNNTGGVITGLSVSYNIEKYRNGSVSNTISFFGGTDGSTWASLPAGDQTFPSDGNTNSVSSVSQVSKTVSITGLNLAAGASYYLRWNYNGTAANAQALGIDDFSVTAVGPAITVAPASLGFGTVRVGDTSPEQSYTVSGTSLAGDLTVTAPAGYEVTTTSGSNYSSSVVLPASSGSVAATPVYVHFIPTANGAANGNITNSSPSAATRNVAVTGSGDNVPPTVSISAPSAALTRGGPVTYTVTYGGASAVTLSESDITLNAGGSATGAVSVSGTGAASRTVTVSGISGDGTLGISIAAGTATDAVGNVAGGAGPSSTFAVDNTAPVATIGAPSVTETRTGPVSFPITYSGATAVTLSAANVTLLSTGTATGSVAVTGTGIASRTVTVSGITGDGTLAIALAGGTATDAAGNQAASAGPSAAVTVDSTVPTISVDAASLTSFGTVRAGDTSAEQSYTVGATGLKGDLTITAPALFEISTVSGSGFGTSVTLTPSERTVTSTTVYVRFHPVADGTFSGNLVHTSLEAATQNVALSGSGDGIPPSVSISAPSATLVNGGSVSYTVTYTGASNITLQPSDVTLTATGTATGAVAVSGSGTASRTVTVSGIGGNGTLRISIAAGTATDAVGNPALAAGPSATFTVDTAPPTISFSNPTPATSLAGPVTWTVNYSGASTVTLSAADVQLIALGDTTGTVAVSGTGLTQRTVTVSGISGNGTLAIQLAAGTASDALGNLSLAAGPSPAATIDTGGPAITFGPPTAFYVRGGNVNYKVFYADAQNITLSPSDIIVNTTGTVTFTVVVDVGQSANNRTVKIQGLSGDGEVSISIKPGSAVDFLGNLASAAGPSLSFFVDNTAPKVVSATAQSTQSIDVIFSELLALDAATTAAYTVAGPGMGTLIAKPDSVTAVSTNTYRLTWAGGREMKQDDPFAVAVANVHDLAGNLLGLPNSAVGLGLGEPPVVTSVIPQSGQSLNVTFSEAVTTGALDALQYTVSGPGMGSVASTPDAVTPAGGNTYLLTWNSGSMVEGAPVTIVVGSVSDLAGNLIDPSNSTTVAALPVTVSGFTIE